MNLLDLPVREGGVEFGDTVYPVAREVLGGHGNTVSLGVRPEDLALSEHGIPVVVELVEELGADAYVHGELADTEQTIIARVDGRRPPQKGQTVHFRPKEGHVHLFDTQTGERLGD
jgi:multiple sugar transport system ATP-binding protein